MSIELLPRARVVSAWPPSRPDPRSLLPALEPAGVRVPVTPRPVLSSGSLGRSLGLAFVVGSVVRGVTRSWGWVLVAVLPILLLGVSTAMPFARLRDRHQADVVLTPHGVLVGGLDVPWWQVEHVLRLRTGTRERTQYFVAVRVRDFVDVRGLTPFWAGLANLTRRRLVVLVQAQEVADPDALVRALQHLVDHPEDRELLTTEPGARLVRAA